jgi:hypothetical protein
MIGGSPGNLTHPVLTPLVEERAGRQPASGKNLFFADCPKQPNELTSGTEIEKIDKSTTGND